MKDPLAPKNPYDLLDVSTAATPDEIEAVFDRFVENNPGMEFEAIELWDELKSPESRLMLDIFQYQASEEIAPLDSSDFELPQIEPEDIARVEQLLINTPNEGAKAIDFGPDKPILDLEFEE